MKERKSKSENNERVNPNFSKEETQKMGIRLAIFVEAEADNYDKEATQEARDTFLGIKSLESLPGNGEGMSFLIVWNSQEESNGVQNQDMEIWAARGEKVIKASGENDKDKLEVSYLRVGKLMHGSRKINSNTRGYKKSGTHFINLDTAAILTP